uniref:Bestrophin homolog n=1 Tax=Mesocestoides corti TaxID=53468 RepID=A0A5K3FTT5_MESCO
MESTTLAGLTNVEELLMFLKNTPLNRPASYVGPCIWAEEIVHNMRKEGSINSDRSVELIVRELSRFRSRLGDILCYDWISVPLVYTQVATLTVYSYTISSLFAWQFLDPSRNLQGQQIDLYIPVFGILRFLFYMGWLKVAESLINPFGEDQDDFELDEIIERNLNVSYSIVDALFDVVPPLSRGVVLDTDEFAPTVDINSNYSVVNSPRRISPMGSELFLGSLANLDVTSKRCRLMSTLGYERFGVAFIVIEWYMLYGTITNLVS